MRIKNSSSMMRAMKVSGQKIRQIRKVLGMSTAQLAEKAQVTRQAVESWERDGVGTFSLLEKIANILGVPEKLLMEDDTQP